MIVGVVGLGLIGGSFAKAYSKAGHTVYAYDTDASTLSLAITDKVVKAELTDSLLPECDLILICTYPEAACTYMDAKGALFGSKPVVMDCCGTKGNIVDKGMSLAEKYDFTYVGGHPMAGTHFSGFQYSRDNLYVGAPMVIVPPKYDDEAFLDHVKKLLDPAGFGTYTVTTAETHDKIIAFSSQLAHVVSNAYIKSPTSRLHAGFSAGSYKDLTRVAWLNPEMWTQLFFDNKDCLVYEIDTIINSLTEYRDALLHDDRDEMKRLLREGKEIKEEVDGQ